MFKLYNKYILPRLLNRSMSPADFNETRSRIVGQASGEVLEIGFGSGYNLPFYKNTEKLYALEPSQELFAYASDRIASASFPVEHLECPAEHIPLKSNSIDAVVSTWTLCSVSDLEKTLSEIHRVLKPNGKFIFAEHGRSPKMMHAAFQKIINPATVFFTGNCHLDRKIDKSVKESGLVIEKIEMFPEEGRPLMFSYRGVAVKPAFDN